VTSPKSPFARLSAALAGRYRIERELGQGGMATVYLAEDPKHRRRVALKVLRPELAATLGADRFLAEIATTANLRHPHILPLFDSGDADGALFYVMPYVEGESLRSRLEREPQLPLADALGIALEVADALSYAHGRGVIHRDIKPENILLENGHAVVADFGIAQAVTDSGGERLTRTGMVVGTPLYMSPEQANGEPLDARSDLYALGCVAYEMLAGAPPFTGATALVVMSRHALDPIPALRTARPEVPGPVAEAIERALAKTPADRYPSAQAWRVAIERPATAADPAASLTSSGTKPSAEGFWVAVLPFRYTGSDPGVAALAEGLSEEIVTGLSRFSYLRVISHSATSGRGEEAGGGRTAGERLGARYVIEGSIRQAGPRLRIAVQLIDASTGAHLWAETYDRQFTADAVFALQDDLVPQIVSTVADMQGVVPRSIGEALRGKPPEQLSPYEAVMRSFGYFERVTAEEHGPALAALELAVRKAPGHPDASAMLAFLLTQGYAQGFTTDPEVLRRAIAAAYRAVEAAPSSHLAHYALAQALFFRKEIQAFRNAADRTLALNPMDGNATSHLGMLVACAGEWERGCALAERATRLNPHHPGWYWFPMFFDAYRRKDYRGAVAAAMRINLPGHVYTSAVRAAAHAQLGEQEAARDALRQLLDLKPESASTVYQDLVKWFDPELTAHLIDGLRKAGLEVLQPPAGRSQ
jgi:serine/threonine-protein kinase